MTDVIFYEKPGCAGSCRQRSLLEEAGHSVTRRDLLSTRFSTLELRAFFRNRPVRDWFNLTDPRIQYGELSPDDFDEQTALRILHADPRLIRQPLLERVSDGAKLVGFVRDEVERFLGEPLPRAELVTLGECALQGAA